MTVEGDDQVSLDDQFDELRREGNSFHGPTYRDRPSIPGMQDVPVYRHPDWPRASQPLLPRPDQDPQVEEEQA